MRFRAGAGAGAGAKGQSVGNGGIDGIGLEDGHAITAFKYVDHVVVDGKRCIPGLPSTFDNSAETSTKTLIIHLSDTVARLSVYLSYTIFANSPAIARSARVQNESAKTETDSWWTIETLSSFSIDFLRSSTPVSAPSRPPMDLVHLSGDWAREATIVRRQVTTGLHGIQSINGYSSHHANPFLALVDAETTEEKGDAYGFSLIWSGSFKGEVERSTDGFTRVLLGTHPNHLDWKLEPGESFTSPESVAVFSPNGLGGMSRALHRLYRNNLSRSEFTLKQRPVLLNNWEATYFDFDAEDLYRIASKASELGVRLFVMDDGWFGNKYPRADDTTSLGDWQVNEKKFPKGLDDLVQRVKQLKVRNTDEAKEGGSNEEETTMQFGIWVEPEMVSPKSELYEQNPSWVLQANGYERTLQRTQLVLDLSQRVVQDHIIDVITKLLSSGTISYVKWDNNRGMHEMPTPSTAHKYLLGLYRILETLTTAFPHVLWEGCASGGGRFDPGMLHYWCQSWTSDNTDGLDRLFIQFGTSLTYPPSAMGGHVSAVPNHQNNRVTPLSFRAHVAMMCGSFGFELDPTKFTQEEQAQIPELIALSEKINPFIIHGDLYRLALPAQSNWPAAQYVLENGKRSVVLAYQVNQGVHARPGRLRLKGLNADKVYTVTGVGRVKGAVLLNVGIDLKMKGDYQSQVVWVEEE